MKTINEIQKLDIAIEELQKQHKEDFEELKNQWQVVKLSIRPSNIVNSGIDELKNKYFNNHSLASNIASIAGGFLSKKVLFGESNNIFKKGLGYFIQYKVSKLISDVTSKEK